VTSKVRGLDELRRRRPCGLEDRAGHDGLSGNDW
jgi:hypothetical protein